MTQICKTAYGGWPNCYRISNGEVELIVTTDVGPRVIRYGFVDGQNLFKEFAEQLGRSGEKSWQARGGHRLWAAPEKIPHTYALDNRAVTVALRDGAISLTSAPERETGLVKQMSVKLAARGTEVEVTHRIRNTRGKSQRLAVWALTMLAQGGRAIAAFPQRGVHPNMLTPTHPLVMWAYTDLSDPRWHFTPKYMLLRQDPKIPAPQKLGQFHERPGGAYLLGDELFVKRAHASRAKTYADFGCSFEMFVNNDFLELETLGPLLDLGPGAATTHRETWTLLRGVKIATWTDAELDRVLADKPAR
jgi:hypothetical protein